MKAKFTILTMLFTVICTLLRAQAPLVYDKENTGAHFPKPTFPAYDQLPLVLPLPDPFVFFDGGGRNTSLSSWEQRRNEIKASIEKYEIGTKPDASGLTITATYAPGAGGGVLTVVVLRNSNGVSLTLNSKVSLPSGTAPAGGWPAVIGMSLAPSGGPVNNSIAKIDFMHDNVTQYAAGQQVSHASDPYFRMYPEYNAGPCPPSPAPCGQQVGQYSAWSWGVSRLIDGMEIAAKQLVNPLPIDIKHLGVNGCSYAGKMALFAGAFDERIAATWAQESGGGGAPAWRVSHGIEPDGTVEKSNNTDGSWFITGFKTDFGRDNIYKLPHDHHELQAMIAPRALFVSGNTDFTWLSNRSTFVTAKATQKIFETLGVGDRYGYWIDGGHGHCALGTGQQAVIDGFYNKFLLGQDVNWNVHVSPTTPAFTNIDHERWYQWWGAPAVTPAQSFTINDRVDDNAVVGTVVATDPDENTTLQDWQITGGTGADKFAINAATGEITVSNRAAIDFDNTSSYTLQVSVSDGIARSAAEIITIQLSHVPVITPDQVFQINAQVSDNAVVGAVLATDKDENTSLQGWQIDGGTGVQIFSINSSSGEIRVANKSLINFDNPHYTLQVSVTDGTNRSNPGLIIIDIDHAPVITPSQVFEINEWVTDNYIVGTAQATDKDENTTLSGWKIVGGTGASVFVINAASGEIKSTNSSTLNFSGTPSYTLVLTVSDGSTTSTQETVTIKVSDKVYVCHDNKSKLVERSKVPDHIKHGDKTGQCNTSQARMTTASAMTALSNRIVVYPNPARGQININLGINSTKVQRIQVVDLSGRVVKQLLVSKNQGIVLPAGTLKAGVYIIRFVGDNVTTQKIVVQ